MVHGSLTKTSDPLGRYYTASAIANLLVSSMETCNPSLVLDLGAGSGSLSQEAAKIWTETRFVTVDIDRKAACSNLESFAQSSFVHHKCDALDENLSEKIGIKFGEADSALCNPPYIRIGWQKHFGEILEDAGLSHVVPKMDEAPADLLFIAQNLRFLKEGGRLGLIIPDGIISGEKFNRLRKELITKHCIEKVIELPRRIFRNTDAKAHIMILAKRGGNSAPISVQRIERDGRLSKVIEVGSELGSHRLDYTYLASLKISPPRNTGIAIGEIAEKLARGSYSSASRKKLCVPIFHTTDFVPNGDLVPEEFILSKEDAAKFDCFKANKGDILISRVGRNFERKICIVPNGEVIISDCIFALTVPKQFQSKVLNFLKSDLGKESLKGEAHGVAARFITTKALLSLKI